MRGVNRDRGDLGDPDLDHHHHYHQSPQVCCLLSPGESWEISTNTACLFWNERREEGGGDKIIYFNLIKRHFIILSPPPCSFFVENTLFFLSIIHVLISIFNLKNSHSLLPFSLFWSFQENPFIYSLHLTAAGSLILRWSLLFSPVPCPPSPSSSWPSPCTAQPDGKVWEGNSKRFCSLDGLQFLALERLAGSWEGTWW